MHTRAITILALIQVGVVVMGNLFVGVVHKMMTEATGGKPLPPAFEWTYHYGSLILLLPVLWVFAVLAIRNQERFPEAERSQVCSVSGIILLMGLVVYFAMTCILAFTRVKTYTL